jgi:hypothetical protein
VYGDGAIHHGPAQLLSETGVQETKSHLSRLQPKMKSFLETQPFCVDAISKNKCQQLRQYPCVFLDKFGSHGNWQLPGETIWTGVRIEKCAYTDEVLPIGKQLRILCALVRSQGSSFGQADRAKTNASRNNASCSMNCSVSAKSSMDAKLTRRGQRCLPHFRVSISSHSICHPCLAAAKLARSARIAAKSLVVGGRPKGDYKWKHTLPSGFCA